MKDIVKSVTRHLCKYYDIKKIARAKHRGELEDSNRYSYSLRWYDAIRTVINYWSEFHPLYSKAVLSTFGFDPVVPWKHRKPVLQASMEFNISTPQLYKYRQEFCADVFRIACIRGLIHEEFPKHCENATRGG